MSYSRLTINALAAAEGLLGALIVFGMTMGFLQVDLEKIAHDGGHPYRRVILVCLAAAVVLAAVAFVFLRTALRYFKWQDRKTATSVAAVFSFSIGFLLFAFVSQFARPDKDGAAASLSFLALEALLMGSAWLLYRFVLKRFAVSAFPTDAIPHPTT